MHTTTPMQLIVAFFIFYSCTCCFQLLAFESVQWSVAQMSNSIVSVDHASMTKYFDKKFSNVEECGELLCHRRNVSCFSRRVRLAPSPTNLFELEAPVLQPGTVFGDAGDTSYFSYPLQLGLAKTPDQSFLLYQMVYEPLVTIECPLRIEHTHCSCVQSLAPCRHELDECTSHDHDHHHQQQEQYSNRRALFGERADLAQSVPIVRPYLSQCTAACPPNTVSIGWESCDLSSAEDQSSPTLEHTACVKAGAKQYARRVCASFESVQIEESLSMDGRCTENYYQKKVYLDRVHQGPVCCSYTFDWNSLSVDQNCSASMSGSQLVYHRLPSSSSSTALSAAGAIRPPAQYPVSRPSPSTSDNKAQSTQIQIDERASFDTQSKRIPYY